jgi:sugar transferase (PEP-CTERM system associated)
MMIRIFKHYVPATLVFVAVLECIALFVAADLAWRWRLAQAGLEITSTPSRLGELLTYTGIVYLVMLSVGLYQVECYRSWQQSTVRLLAAQGISLVLLALVFYLFPNVETWRSVFLPAVLIATPLIVLLRVVFGRIIAWDRFRRRIVVIGAGKRALRLQELQASKPQAGFAIAEFIRMSPAELDVPDAKPLEKVENLGDLMERLKAEELVLAVDERRGGLPISHLLEAKMRGSMVSDLAGFLERETGRVDLATLNPSFLIFSDGFLAGRFWSGIVKRTFDVLISLLLLLFSAPLLLLTALLVKLTSAGPVLYQQERVGQYGKTFKVLKFRSMRTDAEKDGKPQWAQKGDSRVTAVGRVIRATRIDELPQIVNILRGDMSFVGPRPERPFFVDELSREVPYFQERHMVKPGLTGWAQINYPYGASTEDARHKLEYDLYYVKNYTLFLDLLIVVQTVRVILWQDGVR